MKVLIWGLGSVGQRHLRNISKINPKIEFFAIRKKFTTPALNNFNIPQKSDLKKKYNITYLSNINDLDKLNIRINAAFIWAIVRDPGAVIHETSDEKQNSSCAR